MSARRLLRWALPVASLAVLGVLSYAPAALASSAPPLLTFTPSSWTAGPIASGTTTTQTFKLTNTGGKASGALTITLPAASAFSTTADTCTGRSLGPGMSCSVTVQYAPASNGENDTATLAATGTQASTTAPLTGSSTNPFPQSQAACESEGGTFSTDPATDQVQTGGVGVIWTCNNADRPTLDISPLCFSFDGGQGFGSTAVAPFDSTCYAEP